MTEATDGASRIVEGKDEAIQAVMRGLIGRFGTAAFPLSEGRQNDSAWISFTNSRNKRLYFAVGTAGQARNRYFVIVEEHRHFLYFFTTFDIVEYTENIDISEVLDLFAKFNDGSFRIGCSNDFLDAMPTARRGHD